MTLVKKIVLLVGFIFLIHIVFVFAFKILINKKSELWKDVNNFKKNISTKTLFVGDSHTARGINISKVDSAYSLAYFGENNMMNYYKLKYCIEHKLNKPQYVILPCDIVTFSTGFNCLRTNKFFYYSLIPFSEIKNLSDDQISTYYDYAKIKVIPYIEWQYVFNRMNENRNKKSNDRFSDKSINDRIFQAKKFIQEENLMNGSKENLYNDRALDYLKKTINLCKSNNIKLVFVKFPLTQSLFNEIKFHVDSTYILNRPSEKIINQQGIPILDFENLFINNNELFFDCHHLNLNGRREFTEIFKQKLDSLYKIY